MILARHRSIASNLGARRPHEKRPVIIRERMGDERAARHRAASSSGGRAAGGSATIAETSGKTWRMSSTEPTSCEQLLGHLEGQALHGIQQLCHEVCPGRTSAPEAHISHHR